jgi:4-amino-4-deoxy-L-arabinose transferase-like glycosyltransferase
MSFIELIARNRQRYYIIVICIIGFILSAKGIMDESVISMNGDMPKYLMNGAFFYDLIRDVAFADPLGYAYQYYAKYPALSLGHHPILLGVAEVPFYSIFGISVFSGRLTIVFFLLLAAIFLFLLVKSAYGETTAFFSSLLFVTTPYVIEFSRIVMSEIPTLALVTTTAYFYYQYCESGEKRYMVASAVSLSLSIYSKHIAVFMVPVFLFYLLIRKGPRALLKKEVLLSGLTCALLLAPLVLITLKFSRANLDFVTTALSSKSSSAVASLKTRYLYYLNAIWERHLTIPVFILSVISIPVSIYRRDRRTIIFFLWIICLGVMMGYLGWKGSRYTIYWIPAFCLLAALTFNLFQSASWKAAVGILLLVITGYQFIVSFQREPDFTDGYETAARYIIDNKKDGSILYSGIIDTGYFIFFLRKDQTDRDLIILRADKMLATSKMNWIIDNRIKKRDEIYDILTKWGVRYVVIEDVESPSRSLEWLRQEVRSDKFVLRKVIALRSNTPKTDKVPLSIYEYKEYSSPRSGQRLHMNIPLMGDSIDIPFDSLQHAK